MLSGRLGRRYVTVQSMFRAYSSLFICLLEPNVLVRGIMDRFHVIVKTKVGDPGSMKPADD